MLFVFNLDWERFTISDLVVEGNHYLEELSDELGLSGRLIFNCASMGAGEWITGNKKKEAGPPIPPETLDYIRWHHQQVKTAISQSVPFIANRDMTEMLKTLKSEGHDLAVVGTTRTENIEDALIDTRTRHYFGTSVYGYDKCHDSMRGNFTLAALCATAIGEFDMNYEDTLVVADNAVAIQDTVPLQTRGVVGYLDPYVEWNEQTLRVKEMEQAGANFTAVGGHTVSVLPIFLKGHAEQEAHADMQRWVTQNSPKANYSGRHLE